MSGIFHAVKAALDAKGVAYEAVPDREVLRAQFDAHHTRVPLHIQAFEPIGAIHVVSTALFTFEDYHLLKLSELLMRCSEALTIGNFELIWDSRQVLYRAANLFEPTQPFPDRLLHALIHAAVAEMDRLTPVLATISQSDAAALARLNVPDLLQREDWLPDVPPAQDPSNRP